MSKNKEKLFVVKAGDEEITLAKEVTTNKQGDKYTIPVPDEQKKVGSDLHFSQHNNPKIEHLKSRKLNLNINCNSNDLFKNLNLFEEVKYTTIPRDLLWKRTNIQDVQNSFSNCITINGNKNIIDADKFGAFLFGSGFSIPNHATRRGWFVSYNDEYVFLIYKMPYIIRSFNISIQKIKYIEDTVKGNVNANDAGLKAWLTQMFNQLTNRQ